MENASVPFSRLFPRRYGLPNGKGWLGAAHRLYDWTLGCIAVTNSEIEEIWELVPVGTSVEIRP
jgi:hypothetical protein